MPVMVIYSLLCTMVIQVLSTFRDMTVTEFIKMHNLKYDARTVGHVLKKYGYESKKKKVNGTVSRVLTLPYKYRNYDDI